MTRSHKPSVRALSSLLAFTFLASDLAFAAPLDAVVQPSALEALAQDPTRFEAPAEFAALKEIHRGPGGTFIIHIQDAHSNLSGQQNLAGALDDIMRRYQVSLVLAEGGSRDDTLTPIKSVASPKVWQRVAKSFLIEGKISGDEYLNLISDHPMKIMGIEDDELYMRSVREYGRLAEKREETLDYLKKIQAAVARLKARSYPRRLLDYEGRRESRAAGEVDYKELIALARSAGADFAKFPNLARLTALDEKEKAIDFETANLEHAALIEAIAKAGGKGELAASLGASRLKERKVSQYTYFQNTFHIAKTKRVNLSAYPNLAEYAAYLKDFSEIDLDSALEEIVQAEDRAYSLLLPEDDQKILRGIDRYVKLLFTAYNIQMSTRDFALFRANEKDFATARELAFLNRRLAEAGCIEDLLPYRDTLEKGRDALESFYDSVNQRDFAFVRNAERILKEENQRVAVLISGGYHTPHLKKLFREKGFSYAVLTPVVTSQTNQAKYERLLLAPVRKGFRGARTPAGESGEKPLSALEEDLILAKKKSDGVSVQKTGEPQSGARLAELVAAAANLETGDAEVAEERAAKATLGFYSRDRKAAVTVPPAAPVLETAPAPVSAPVRPRPAGPEFFPGTGARLAQLDPSRTAERIAEIRRYSGLDLDTRGLQLLADYFTPSNARDMAGAVRHFTSFAGQDRARHALALMSLIRTYVVRDAMEEVVRASEEPFSLVQRTPTGFDTSRISPIENPFTDQKLFFLEESHYDPRARELAIQFLRRSLPSISGEPERWGVIVERADYRRTQPFSGEAGQIVASVAEIFGVLLPEAVVTFDDWEYMRTVVEGLTGVMSASNILGGILFGYATTYGVAFRDIIDDVAYKWVEQGGVGRSDLEGWLREFQERPLAESIPLARAVLSLSRDYRETIGRRRLHAVMQQHPEIENYLIVAGVRHQEVKRAFLSYGVLGEEKEDGARLANVEKEAGPRPADIEDFIGDAPVPQAWTITTMEGALSPEIFERVRPAVADAPEILAIGPSVRDVFFLAERYPKGLIRIVELSREILKKRKMIFDADPSLAGRVRYARADASKLSSYRRPDGQPAFPDASVDLVYAAGVNATTFSDEALGRAMLSSMAGEEVRLLRAGGVIYHPQDARNYEQASLDGRIERLDPKVPHFYRKADSPAAAAFGARLPTFLKHPILSGAVLLLSVFPSWAGRLFPGLRRYLEAAPGRLASVTQAENALHFSAVPYDFITRHFPTRVRAVFGEEPASISHRSGEYRQPAIAGDGTILVSEQNAVFVPADQLPPGRTMLTSHLKSCSAAIAVLTTADGRTIYMLSHQYRYAFDRVTAFPLAELFRGLAIRKAEIYTRAYEDAHEIRESVEKLRAEALKADPSFEVVHTEGRHKWGAAVTLTAGADAVRAHEWSWRAVFPMDHQVVDFSRARARLLFESSVKGSRLVDAAAPTLEEASAIVRARERIFGGARLAEGKRVTLGGEEFTMFPSLEGGRKAIELWSDPNGKAMDLRPDLMAYAVRLEPGSEEYGLRGVWVKPSLRGGMLRALLALYFKTYPEVRATAVDTHNLVLLDVLARDYGFAPPAGARPNGYLKDGVFHLNAEAAAEFARAAQSIRTSIRTQSAADLSPFLGDAAARPVYLGQIFRRDGARLAALDDDGVRRLMDASAAVKSLRGEWAFAPGDAERVLEWRRSEAVLPEPDLALKIFTHVLALYSASGLKPRHAEWIDLLAAKWGVSAKALNGLVRWFLSYSKVDLKKVSPAAFAEFLRYYVDGYQKNPALRSDFVYYLPPGISDELKINLAAENMQRMRQLVSEEFLRKDSVIKAPIEGTRYFVGIQYGLAESTHGLYLAVGEEKNGKDPMEGVFFRLGLDTQDGALRVNMMQGVSGRQKPINETFPQETGLHPGVALLYFALQLAGRGTLRVREPAAEPLTFERMMGIRPEFIPTMKHGQPTLIIPANYTRFGMRKRSDFARWRETAELERFMQSRLAFLEGQDPREMRSIRSMAAAFGSAEEILVNLIEQTEHPELHDPVERRDEEGPAEEARADGARLSQQVLYSQVELPAGMTKLSERLSASDPREIAPGVEVRVLGVEDASARARGEATFIDPAGYDFVQRHEPRIFEKDIVFPMTHHDPVAGHTVQEWVAREEDPSLVVAAFNKSQGHGWEPNTLTVQDGELLMRAKGRRGVNQPVYEAPQGIYWVLSFDADKRGVFPLTIGPDGKAAGAVPVRNGFGGPLLVKDGVSRVSEIRFGVKPAFGNALGWPASQAASLSAYGYDARGRLVIVQLSGNPDDPEKGETTIERLVEALLALGVRDAILGGSSGDVQRYFAGQTPEVVRAQARKGSQFHLVTEILEEGQTPGEGQRRLGEVFLAVRKGARLAREKRDPFEYRFYSELSEGMKTEKKILRLLRGLLLESGVYEDAAVELRSLYEQPYKGGQADAFVAYSRGAPIGIYRFVELPDGKTAQGAGIFASGLVRRRRLGTRLRDRLFTHLKTKGFERFEIGSDASPIAQDNVRAQAFHEDFIASQEAAGSLAVVRHESGKIKRITVDLGKFRPEARLASLSQEDVTPQVDIRSPAVRAEDFDRVHEIDPALTFTGRIVSGSQGRVYVVQTPDGRTAGLKFPQQGKDITRELSGPAPADRAGSRHVARALGAYRFQDGVSRAFTKEEFESPDPPYVSALLVEWVEGEAVEDAVTQGRLSSDDVVALAAEVMDDFARPEVNLYYTDVKAENALLRAREGADAAAPAVARYEIVIVDRGGFNPIPRGLNRDMVVGEQKKKFARNILEMAGLTGARLAQTPALDDLARLESSLDGIVTEDPSVREYLDQLKRTARSREEIAADRALVGAETGELTVRMAAAREGEAKKGWWTRTFSNTSAAAKAGLVRDAARLRELADSTASLDRWEESVSQYEATLQSGLRDAAAAAARTSVDRVRAAVRAARESLADDRAFLAGMNAAYLEEQARPRLAALVDEGSISAETMEVYLAIALESLNEGANLDHRLPREEYVRRRAALEDRTRRLDEMRRGSGNLYSLDYAFGFPLRDPSEYYRPVLEALAARAERRLLSRLAAGIPEVYVEAQSVASSAAEAVESRLPLQMNFHTLGRWSVLSSHPAVEELAGESDPLRQLEEELKDAAVGKLLVSQEHRDETISLGYLLFWLAERRPEFRVELAPVLIANAWRESGRSGERPFLPTPNLYSGAEDQAPLMRFASSLEASHLEALRDVPGVVRVLDILKNNPRKWYRQEIETAPWAAFQKSLASRSEGQGDALTLLKEYLKLSAADRTASPFHAAFTAASEASGFRPDSLQEVSYDEVHEPNPIYLALHEALTSLALHLLRQDESRQSYVMGLLGMLATNMPLPENAYDAIEEILRRTGNENLRSEILRMVMRRTGSGEWGDYRATLIILDALDAVPEAMRREIRDAAPKLLITFLNRQGIKDEEYAVLGRALAPAIEAALPGVNPAAAVKAVVEFMSEVTRLPNAEPFSRYEPEALADYLRLSARPDALPFIRALAAEGAYRFSISHGPDFLKHLQTRPAEGEDAIVVTLRRIRTSLPDFRYDPPYDFVYPDPGNSVSVLVYDLDPERSLLHQMLQSSVSNGFDQLETLRVKDGPLFGRIASALYAMRRSRADFLGAADAPESPDAFVAALREFLPAYAVGGTAAPFRVALGNYHFLDLLARYPRLGLVSTGTLSIVRLASAVDARLLPWLLGTDLFGFLQTEEELAEFVEDLAFWKEHAPNFEALVALISPSSNHDLYRSPFSHAAVTALGLDVLRSRTLNYVNVLENILQFIGAEEADAAFRAFVADRSVDLRVRMDAADDYLELVNIRGMAASYPADNEQAAALAAALGKAFEAVNGLLVEIAAAETSSQKRKLQGRMTRELTDVRRALLRYYLRREIAEGEESLLGDAVVSKQIFTVVSIVSTLEMAGGFSEPALAREFFRLYLDRLFAAYAEAGSAAAGPAAVEAAKAKAGAFLNGFGAEDLAALHERLRAEGQMRFAAPRASSNRETRETLIAAGYDPKLWTEGIDFEMRLSDGITAEAKKEQIFHMAYEMVEIAAALGVDELNGEPVGTQFTPAKIDTSAKAQAFYEALRRSGAAPSDAQEDRFEEILSNMQAVEAKTPGSVDPADFRVTLKKDFLAEATAGLGVPGCFAPTGIHREMPFVTGAETASFFIQIYGEQGRQAANAVVVLGENGAYVYSGYNGSGYDMNAAYAKAIIRLAAMAPKVFLSSNSAGFSSLRQYAEAEPELMTVVKPSSVFSAQYFDAGHVDSEGTLTLQLDQPLSLTREALERKGAFVEAPKQEPAPEPVAPASLNWQDLADTFSRDADLKRFFFLVGSFKKRVGQEGRFVADDAFYEWVKSEIERNKAFADTPRETSERVADAMLDFLERQNWPLDIQTPPGARLASRLVPRTVRLADFLGGTSPADAQIVLVADNTGTLTPNFEEPIGGGILRALKTFAASPNHTVVIDSGDPFNALFSKSHKPFLDDAPAGSLERYHFVADSGTHRAGFDAAGNVRYNRVLGPWETADRFAYARALAEFFYDQLKKRQGPLAGLLSGVTDAQLDAIRDESLARLDRIGADGAWGRTEGIEGGDVYRFHLMPGEFKEALGQMSVYDRGAKVTIEAQKHTDVVALEFMSDILARFTERFGPARPDFYTVAGNGYLDVTRTSKLEGVEKTLADEVYPKLDPKKKTLILVIGDSDNDIPTFNLKTPEGLDASVVRVFLTRHPRYAELLPEDTLVARPHLDGTLEALDFLNGDAPEFEALVWEKEEGARLAETPLDASVRAMWSEYWGVRTGQRFEGAFDNYPPFIFNYVALAIRGEFGDAAGKRFLDVGAGADLWVSRRLSTAFPGTEIHALDLIDVDPARVRGAERVLYRKAAAEATNFADGELDLVLSTFGVDYADRDRATDEMSRVLKTGGKAVLVLHAPGSPFYEDIAKQLEKSHTAETYYKDLSAALAGDDFARVNVLLAQRGYILPIGPAQKDSMLADVARFLGAARAKTATYERVLSNAFNTIGAARRYYYGHGFRVISSGKIDYPGENFHAAWGLVLEKMPRSGPPSAVADAKRLLPSLKALTDGENAGIAADVSSWLSAALTGKGDNDSAAFAAELKTYNETILLPRGYLLERGSGLPDEGTDTLQLFKVLSEETRTVETGPVRVFFVRPLTVTEDDGQGWPTVMGWNAFDNDYSVVLPENAARFVDRRLLALANGTAKDLAPHRRLTATEPGAEAARIGLDTRRVLIADAFRGVPRDRMVAEILEKAIRHEVEHENRRRLASGTRRGAAMDHDVEEEIAYLSNLRDPDLNVRYTFSNTISNAVRFDEPYDWYILAAMTGRPHLTLKTRFAAVENLEIMKAAAVLAEKSDGEIRAAAQAAYERTDELWRKFYGLPPGARLAAKKPAGVLDAAREFDREKTPALLTGPDKAVAAEVSEWLKIQTGDKDETHKYDFIDVLRGYSDEILLPKGYLLELSPDYATSGREPFELFRVEGEEARSTRAGDVRVLFVRSLTAGLDLSSTMMGWSSDHNDFVAVIPPNIARLVDERILPLLQGKPVAFEPDATLTQSEFGRQAAAAGLALRPALLQKAFPRPAAAELNSLFREIAIRHELEHEVRRRQLEAVRNKRLADVDLEEELAELSTMRDPALNARYVLFNLVSAAIRYNSSHYWFLLARLNGVEGLARKARLAPEEKLSVMKATADKLALLDDAALRALADRAYGEAEKEWEMYYDMPHGDAVQGARLAVFATPGTEPIRASELSSPSVVVAPYQEKHPVNWMEWLPQSVYELGLPREYRYTAWEMVFNALSHQVSAENPRPSVTVAFTLYDRAGSSRPVLELTVDQPEVSDVDWETIRRGAEKLAEFGIPYLLNTHARREEGAIGGLGFMNLGNLMKMLPVTVRYERGEGGALRTTLYFEVPEAGARLAVVTEREEVRAAFDGLTESDRKEFIARLTRNVYAEFHSETEGDLGERLSAAGLIEYGSVRGDVLSALYDKFPSYDGSDSEDVRTPADLAGARLAVLNASSTMKVLVDALNQEEGVSVEFEDETSGRAITTLTQQMSRPYRVEVENALLGILRRFLHDRNVRAKVLIKREAGAVSIDFLSGDSGAYDEMKDVEKGVLLRAGAFTEFGRFYGFGPWRTQFRVTFPDERPLTVRTFLNQGEIDEIGKKYTTEEGRNAQTMTRHMYTYNFGTLREKWKDSLDGDEAMVVGPYRNAQDILALLASYPRLRALHLVEIDIDSFQALHKQLLESGVKLPEIYAYRQSVLELPSELTGRLGLLFDKYVFAEGWFSEGHLQRSGDEIRRVLRPGGVHVSAGHAHQYPGHPEASGMAVLETNANETIFQKAGTVEVFKIEEAAPIEGPQAMAGARLAAEADAPYRFLGALALPEMADWESLDRTFERDPALKEIFLRAILARVIDREPISIQTQDRAGFFRREGQTLVLLDKDTREPVLQDGQPVRFAPTAEELAAAKETLRVAPPATAELLAKTEAVVTETGTLSDLLREREQSAETVLAALDRHLALVPSTPLLSIAKNLDALPDDPARPETFDVYVANYLVTVLEISRTSAAKNVVFRLTGAEARVARALRTPLAQRLLAGNLLRIDRPVDPETGLAARELDLTTAAGVRPGTPYLPEAALLAGEVANFKTTVLLSIFAGRVNADTPPESFLNAYRAALGSQAAQGLEARVVSRFLKGDASQGTLSLALQFALRPIRAIEWSKLVQFYQNVQRMVMQAA